MTRRLRLLTLILPFVVAACDTFGSDGSNELLNQLERAETRWEANGAANYSFVLNRHCNCSTPPPVVRVHVVNNQVVSATFVGDEAPVPAAQLVQFRPLDDWFDVIRDAIRNRTPQLQVEYEQELGYPQSLVINYDITTSTDDIFFTIASYTPDEEG